ncbi:uncharacterized protein LOC131431947 [Malaya genurostris]|uniref:uncharacterized protein LOC131431947 n=1 Tax=Malaya genurostris TaxID=325434 RepID=UPI0026F3C0C9|nr:uncharacterized protein LOC131431947 [Malaya genurostris]
MSIDRLPAEILQKIFDYLPRAEQLQKTRINRRWNRLSLRETYLILAYGEQLISERLLRRTTRGYCCFSIEFSEAYEELRSRLCICAQKFSLRKLILDGIQTYAMVSFVSEHGSWLRSLVQLSVTVSNQIDSSQINVQLDLPRLRILSWTYNTEGCSSALPVFRLNAPSLEDAFIECLETERCPLILENTGKLKSLGLFVPKLIEHLCPDGLNSLDCLRIYNSSRPFAWNIDQCSLSRLKVLELCGCVVSGVSLSFIRNFPQLETLVIQTELNNPINLSIIANSLPNLKQLRLFDVRYIYEPGMLTFPSLQTLDINDVMCDHADHQLEINAPYLMTLKGTNLNLILLELTKYSTVKSLIVFGLYLNFPRPRLFESVMILYLDVPCNTSNAMLAMNPHTILLTECLHQFPNLTRLTVVLHDKRVPVAISGFLLAISFVNLRYLHLRDFDLDYNFLVGIKKANIRTLILQDGTLNTTADNVPLHFSELQHFFVQNVKLPKDVTEFPVLYPPMEMILALAESNVFSSECWDENVVKSREDYLTYLQY